MLIPELSLNTEQIIVSRALLYKFWRYFCPIRDIRDSNIAKKLLHEKHFHFESQSDYVREVYTSAVIDYFYYLKYNYKLHREFKSPIELYYPDPDYPNRMLKKNNRNSKVHPIHKMHENTSVFINNQQQLARDIKQISLKYCGLDKHSEIAKIK